MKNNNVSCLFWYTKRAFRFDNVAKKSVPLSNADGTPRMNDNYLSFLQVISTYWEEVTEGNFQLNIFMNGGSVSVDRETGERTMKAGFTVVLPHRIGEKFMQQFYAWSETFGLAATPPPAHRVNERSERSETPRRARQIDADEFGLPDEPISPGAAEATFEN